MPFAFEKLLVYQKAIDFADAVCQHTEHFSRGYGFLVDQLNRAALSIAANIAEGNGRFTIPDRRNFFGIARGSVQECVPLSVVPLARNTRSRTPVSCLEGQAARSSITYRVVSWVRPHIWCGGVHRALYSLRRLGTAKSSILWRCRSGGWYLYWPGNV